MIDISNEALPPLIAAEASKIGLERCASMRTAQ